MNTILPKAIASTVNVTVVFCLTFPIYILAGLNWWRGSCVGLFLIYNLLLSRRCLGMIIARTRLNMPASPAYAAMYTASFSTLLFWIWVPLDLALANGLMLQLPCLLIYKNTAHGLLAGRRTMTENEILFEAIALKGQCPDCHAVKLESNGPYVHCKVCHSIFVAQQFYVRRVEQSDILQKMMTTGEVVLLK